MATGGTKFVCTRGHCVEMSSDSNPEVQLQTAAQGTECHDSTLSTQGAQAVFTEEQLQVNYPHTQRTFHTHNLTPSTQSNNPLIHSRCEIVRIRTRTAAIRFSAASFSMKPLPNIHSLWTQLHIKIPVVPHFLIIALLVSSLK
jgi:hypothetical protein